MDKNRINIKKITTIALFCALAYVVEFVFRIKVGFLTFDAKDAIITIEAMFFGPVSGLVTAIVVALIEMLTVSDTGLYGFVMNVASTVAFAVVASAIYKHKKTLKGAILGLLTGIISMSAVMVGMNLLVTPLYMKADISAVLKIIPTMILPFNFTKALFNTALVLILYKPISVALKRIGVAGDKNEKYSFDKTTIIMLISGIVTLTVALVIFIVVLNGKIV